jgi:hypothetical protein
VTARETPGCIAPSPPDASRFVSVDAGNWLQKQSATSIGCAGDDAKTTH